MAQNHEYDKQPENRTYKRPVVTKANVRRGGPANSSYNVNTAITICNLITQGYSLTKISKIKGLPTYTTIARWLRTYPSFYEKFCQAKVLQTTKHIDDIMDIADDCDETSKAGVQKAKLQVDTRRWAAERLMPRVYGNKLGIETSDSKDTKKQIAKLEGIVKKVQKQIESNAIILVPEETTDE